MCPDGQGEADMAPTAAMLRMISGFWLSRALYAAAKLGLADLLKGGPRTVDDLAKLSGTHAPSLYRVLRALASAGVFSEAPDGRFSSTPLSSTLETDAPASLRGFAIAELGEDHYPAWAELLNSVRTGEIAFNRLFGMSVWEYRAQHPDDARVFDEAMASFTAAGNEAILSGYDFSPFRKIVDVGGGDGSLIEGILKTNPAMLGVVFDLPHAVMHAQQRLEAAGLTNRCQAIKGDFFESVPNGGEAYVLKWIIHDWDDDKAVTILRHCRRAMPQQAKLLLIEAVIPPGNTPSFHKFMDLNMLVMTGGRERTEDEYRALLAAADLNLTKIIATRSEMSVLEAART
jgi:O-methyltransferase domain/Dimerisation domain